MRALKREVDWLSAPEDRPGAVGEQAYPVSAPPAAALDLGLDEARSPREATCAYLRMVGPGGDLARPRDAAAEGQACIAMGEPAGLSERQQALVCLTQAHASCPRYLRAIMAVPGAEPVAAALRRPHPATLVATVLLAVSAVVAVAFVATNGGLAMPSTSTEPSPGASDMGAASATATAVPSVGPTATAGTSTDPSPSQAASPSPSPSPSPTPAPTPTPRPTSDRYELLEPCPGKPDCYIYTVRAGDNLVSIANYFGVPLATVYDLNPWLRGSGLRAGQKLTLPPPTR